MRILIIGINYTPEQTGIGPYTAGLAEYLAVQGHTVDVVTGLPSYPEWKIHEGFRRVIWRKDCEQGVAVHRRWHFIPSTQTALRRLAYEGSFFLTGLSSMKLARPDLVVGIIPTLSGGFLAQLASRRFKVPYALLFQDLMGPAAAQTGVSGASTVAGLVKRVERNIAARATVVTIVAEGFRPYLESLGVSSDRIHRVRNWNRAKPPTKGRIEARNQFGFVENHLTCLHAGNMGHKQALENVVECARLANATDSTLHFILMGDGNQRSKLKNLADAYGLLNLRFLELQSEEDFSNVLDACDILLLNQRAGVAEMALPSKLTAYLAAGRPVVAAVESESEAARELHSAEAGVVVYPENPRALLAALVNLKNDRSLREKMGRNGQSHAQSELSASTALPALEHILLGATSSGHCMGGEPATQ